jgi:hypothetical protein
MVASRKLIELSKQRTKEPNVILEIEGLDFAFSTLPVGTLWRFDEGYEFDTEDLRFDTPFPNPAYIPIISAKDSTKTVRQQILPDKGGTGSVPTINIALVNKDNQAFNLLKFDNNFVDVLGKKAKLYFTYQGASHPTDSLPIINGYIDDYSIQHGNIILSVSHAENLKRKEMFIQYIDALTADINDTTTTIPVSTTEGLLESADIMTSYIRIGDEVMLVNSKTSTTINVTRGQFETITDDHSQDAEVSSKYRLTDQPISLALKLYMSGSGFNADLSIESINNQEIFFAAIDLPRDYGIVEGDTIQISGSTSNDGQYIISSVTSDENGSTVTVTSSLTNEPDTTATASFKSKYDVLPLGLGLTGEEVDIEGHETIERFNPNSFPDYTFDLEEAEDGKEFIDREVYYPVSLYSLPREAKISLKLVQPPLATSRIRILDETTVEKIENVNIKRSTHNYLYNTLFYRFEEDPVEKNFTSASLFRNEVSIQRIPIGTKLYEVESRGLRESADTRNLLFRQHQRIFDRYKNAAQEISNVRPLGQEAFDIEVGDIVVFGSDNVQLVDLSKNQDFFEARLVEVINKSFSLFTGEIQTTLLESAFELNARYGIISPSSFVDVGATLTTIPLKLSFSVGEFENEPEKWIDYVGLSLRVRTQDYCEDFNTKILSVDPANPNIIVVQEMPQIPQEDWVIEIVNYPTAEPLYKDAFVYFNPRSEITSVASAQEFDVDDPTLFYVGSPIYVATSNFSYDSFDDQDIEVDAISGNTITLNSPLSVIPPVGASVELIGFSSDEGPPYRLI